MKLYQELKSLSISNIIGLILLLPPILSVILFFAGIFSEDLNKIFNNLSNVWSAIVRTDMDHSGAGATSALPIYFGLMAIAGALLLKTK